MEVSKTDLPEILLIKPDVFADNRGWFMETYSYEKYKKFGIDVKFVQDNRSRTESKGTVRGLHFQKSPKAQSKLVTCTRGCFIDVVVDIRKNSPTYKKWVAVELSEENKYQLFVPKGFAHGFVALKDETEILYKVDEFYSKEFDRSIRFDDPEIAVDWGIESPILSEKDMLAPFLSQSDADF
ncbi:MAG: dTDP-4-dehydrorhamnose 3,5-epimerase [Clostridia bacterium]|nr:dTDP-4-dehydrorhamnose 3,5-epimerase [Clostridia bacterium]